MPFTTVQIGDRSIEVDLERTRAAYARVERGRAERCGCLYCRNFVEARDNIYPAAFLAILESLGIAFDKEAEVYEYGPIEAGFAGYGGRFNFFGTAARDPEPSIARDEPTDDFRSGFSAEYPAFHTELTGAKWSIQFHCRVPWLLDEQPPVSYKAKS